MQKGYRARMLAASGDGEPAPKCLSTKRSPCLNVDCNSFIKMFVFVSPAVDAEAEEKVCNIQCDSLNKDDYLDLLWTAAAELPGECANHITHHLIAKRFPNYH